MPYYIDIKETGLKARNYRHVMVRREVNTAWRTDDSHRFNMRKGSSQYAIISGLLTSFLLLGLSYLALPFLAEGQSLQSNFSRTLSPFTIASIYFACYLSYHWVKKLID